MKKIIIITLLFLLVGCKSMGDELLVSNEEHIIIRGGSAFIVKIESVEDTVQDFYIDDTVPKTIFNAHCIYEIEGECENDILISRYGGYNQEGKFIGVTNEFMGYPEYIEKNSSSKYNLFNEGSFYLVVVDETEGNYTTLNAIELEDYVETLSPFEQSNEITKLINGFITNLNIFRDYLKENALEVLNESQVITEDFSATDYKINGFNVLVKDIGTNCNNLSDFEVDLEHHNLKLTNQCEIFGGELYVEIGSSAYKMTDFLTYAYEYYDGEEDSLSDLSVTYTRKN